MCFCKKFKNSNPKILKQKNKPLLKTVVSNQTCKRKYGEILKEIVAYGTDMTNKASI